MSRNAGVQQLTVSINGGAAQTVSVDSQGNFSFNPNLATDGSAVGSKSSMLRQNPSFTPFPDWRWLALQVCNGRPFA